MTDQIKAVFFDFDGTLRIPTPGPTDAFVEYARSLNIDISPAVEKRVKLWAHRYWGQEHLVKKDIKRFDTDDFWINYSKLLLQKVDVSIDLMKRARLIREWFDQEYKPEVNLVGGCQQTLTKLREMGFVLGVISNRPDPLHEELTVLGLDGYFDINLTAGEVGFWKPNPKIFHYAIDQFVDLQAAECIYVGDNYHADYLGAKAAGLTPILYDPENLYDHSNHQRIRQMSELNQVLFEENGSGRVFPAVNGRSKNRAIQSTLTNR